MDEKLHFIAPSSRFHPSFWELLYSNTLNKYNNPSFQSVDNVKMSDSSKLFGKKPRLVCISSCSLGTRNLDRNEHESFDFSNASFLDERNEDINSQSEAFSLRGILYSAKTIEVPLRLRLLLETIRRIC